MLVAGGWSPADIDGRMRVGWPYVGLSLPELMRATSAVRRVEADRLGRHLTMLGAMWGKEGAEAFERLTQELRT